MIGLFRKLLALPGVLPFLFPFTMAFLALLLLDTAFALL
jgi:hypothetical protein